MSDFMYEMRVANARIAELEAERDELAARVVVMRDILMRLKWKSTDKDNMEYRCDTTYYVIDQIHSAIGERLPDRAKLLGDVVRKAEEWQVFPQDEICQRLLSEAIAAWRAKP